MKRILLHTLFWFCYFLQFAFTSYLWDKGTKISLSSVQLIYVNIIEGIIYLIPQMIFPYYMIYYANNNIIKKRHNIIYNSFEIAAVFFICIVIDRAITNYIVLPYLYKTPNAAAPLLEIKKVIVTILYLIFAYGLMLAIKSVRDQLKATVREKNLIKEKLETELKFLKNQTNPHFLLNTLNNIYALARKKSDDTAEVVMRLSELLRFMLYESNDKLIKLTDEIKGVEGYLELETIRYNERLSVSFEKDIDDNNYQITPLLLLPFIENAFKHGISETRFESFINITIIVKNHILNFEVQNSKDNGGQLKSCSSIGLNNVKRQLELTYSDYKMNVQNDDDVFKLNLTINLNSYVEI
ncbi:MAG: histidine kinase [Parafilimonas sp.]